MEIGTTGEFTHPPALIESNKSASAVGHAIAANHFDQVGGRSVP